MNLKSTITGVLLSAGIGPVWARRAYRDDVNMKKLLAFSLNVDSNCIDVGAHKGRVLGDLVRLAPAGRHIAYEPLPYLADLLRVSFPNVDVREAAASNVDGSSSFTHVKNLPSYSGFRPRSYPRRVDLEAISVKTERIDGHLPAGYVPSLIKIDVEGAEQLVIEGAIETISQHRPCVLFEHGVGGSDHYGTSPRDIYRLLCETAGLRIFDLDGQGPYSIADLDGVYARNERWNFVAHR